VAQYYLQYKISYYLLFCSSLCIYKKLCTKKLQISKSRTKDIEVTCDCPPAASSPLIVWNTVEDDRGYPKWDVYSLHRDDP